MGCQKQREEQLLVCETLVNIWFCSPVCAEALFYRLALVVRDRSSTLTPAHVKEALAFWVRSLCRCPTASMPDPSRLSPRGSADCPGCPRAVGGANPERLEPVALTIAPKDNFELSVNQACMFWGSGRKPPEYPEKSYAGTETRHRKAGGALTDRSAGSCWTWAHARGIRSSNRFGLLLMLGSN